MMKQYISEYRAIYEDEFHGLFGRKLAEWAIGNIKVMSNGKLVPITQRTVENVCETLIAYGINLPEKYIYTAWYLFHMALADYPKTLRSDEQRSRFVEETICDPDGDPTNVLACFEAKMCNAGIPIYWEMMT